MTLNLNNPSDIYLRVNEKIDEILGSLTGTSTDATLNLAQKEAHELLTQRQAFVQSQLDELKKYAEWKTFTIAFYGETGAGKSTIIETLRILLGEPGKVARQLKFRELKQRHTLSEENAQHLHHAIAQASSQIKDLEQELSMASQYHAQLNSDTLKTNNLANAHLVEVIQHLNAVFHEQKQQYDVAFNAIANIQTFITDRKENASIWQKLLSLFRKMPEDDELAIAKQRLLGITNARDNAGMTLSNKQRELEQSKLANRQQLLELEAEHDTACKSLVAKQATAEESIRAVSQQLQQHEIGQQQLLTELAQHADGEIIGDGRPDFTLKTQRYDLALSGHSFALLDVPGIEGNEHLVDGPIDQAVKTAHAVFYVTNQAAPPQTGDDERKGTLEKIKAHLGSQTEVWTIFNKKTTSPKFAFTGGSLTSEDENLGLKELDKKMRGQLGKHYREVFPLTALPAFFAITDHFVPNSKIADNRIKWISAFSAEELLKKSRLNAFLELLENQLLSGSKEKISRANFHKANEAVGQCTRILEKININFVKLSEKLHLEGQSSKVQLDGSFSALKTRLSATGQQQVDKLANNVRKVMYKSIDGDVSNDSFKNSFEKCINMEIERLGNQLPEAITKDFVRFQQDAEAILKRFEVHAGELAAAYSKLAKTKLDNKFNLKINIDNGLKVTNLIMTLAGGALLAWNPAGWLLIALSVSGLVLGVYKAVKSYFSSDFKKAQQRTAVEDNLQRIVKQLLHTLHDSLKNSLPEMQEKIVLLNAALEAPSKKTNALVELLSASVSQLKILSRQINNLGSA